MERVFEIVKVKGLGLVECQWEEFSTGLIYHNKPDAKLEADRLWKEQTTEADRETGWCALNYIVKERTIK